MMSSSSTTFSLTQRYLILKYFLDFSNECLDFTSDPNAPSLGKGSRSCVPALGAAAAPGAGRVPLLALGGRRGEESSHFAPRQYSGEFLRLTRGKSQFDSSTGRWPWPFLLSPGSVPASSSSHRTPSAACGRRERGEGRECFLRSVPVRFGGAAAPAGGASVCGLSLAGPLRAARNRRPRTAGGTRQRETKGLKVSIFQECQSRRLVLLLLYHGSMKQLAEAVGSVREERSCNAAERRSVAAVPAARR